MTYHEYIGKIWFPSEKPPRVVMVLRKHTRNKFHIWFCTSGSGKYFQCTSGSGKYFQSIRIKTVFRENAEAHCDTFTN